MPCVPEKENFLDAYNEEKSVVASQHADWSASQQRKAVAEFLRPKFQMDMAAAAREARGETQYTVEEAAFTVNEHGDVYYTKYGRSLEELNERTQRLQPDAYSETDHATSRLIQESFRQGATQVVTGYYREGDDHRDIVVMQFDPITKEGTTCIVTAADNGITQSFESLKIKARESFSDLHIASPDERVFVLSDVSVNTYRASYITKPVLQEQKKSIPLPFDQQVMKATTDTMAYVGVRTAQEMRETVDKVYEYTKKKITDSIQKKKKEIRNHLPGFLTAWMPHKEKTKHGVSIQEHIHIDTQKKSVEHKRTGKKKSDSHTVFIHKHVIKEHQIISEKKILTAEKKRKHVSNLHSESNPGKKEKKQLSVIQEKVSVTPEQHKDQMMKYTKEYVKQKNVIRTPETKMKKVEKRQKTEVMKKEKQMHTAYEFVIFIKKIREKIKRIAILQKEEQSKTPRQKKEIKIQHICWSVTYAIVLWNFLNAITRREIQKNPYKNADTQEKKNMVRDKAVFVEECVHPWLLFSIIWYLVMLREHNVYQPVQKKKMKKKMHTKKSQTIYSFANTNDQQVHSFFVI